MNNRNLTLDYLRGTGIILMILMHSLAYYFVQWGTYVLWDVIHIVVPIFVFVSSWLYFDKGHEVHLKAAFAYYKKRLIRLMVPYYIFLIPFIIFAYFFDSKPISLKSVVENMSLTGGVDINWLVLLFIMMMVLTPFYYFLAKHRPFFFGAAGGISLASTAVLMFYNPPFDYRLMMFIPWSLVIFVAYFFLKYKDRKYFIPVLAVVSFVIFVTTRAILSSIHHTLVFQLNKYPPNLYYLSYGTMWMIVLYSIYGNTRIMSFKPLNYVLKFFSRHSYTIFFIHFLLIYYVSKLYPYTTWPWWKFFIIIFSGSYILQLTINKAIELNRREYY